MKIAVDIREKLPFSFTGFSDVQTVSAHLATGDYAIKGLENRCCVERKSIGDLALCLGRDRNRFFAEMQRARSIPAFSVVVEAPFTDLEQGLYRSRLPAKSATSSVISLMCRWGINFFFAEDRSQAERFVYDFFRLYLQGHQRELVAVQKALSEA